MNHFQTIYLKVQLSRRTGVIRKRKLLTPLDNGRPILTNVSLFCIGSLKMLLFIWNNKNRGDKEFELLYIYQFMIQSTWMYPYMHLLDWNKTWTVVLIPPENSNSPRSQYYYKVRLRVLYKPVCKTLIDTWIYVSIITIESLYFL